MDTNKINIRQFKLLNGEEIIAAVSQREPDHYIVERPFAVRCNMIGGWAFVPWFPFSSQKLFKIAKENIMYHVEIDEDVKTEYIRLATNQNMKPKLRTEEDLEKQLMDDIENWVEESREEIRDIMDEKEDKTRTIH